MFSFLFISAVLVTGSLACDKGFCISPEICDKINFIQVIDASNECAGARVCCQQSKSISKRQSGLLGSFLGGGGGSSGDFGDLIDKAMTLAKVADFVGVDIPPELSGALQAAEVANDLVNGGVPDSLSDALDVGRMLVNAADLLGGGDLAGLVAGQAGLDAGSLVQMFLPDVGDLAAGLAGGLLPDIPDVGDILGGGGIPDIPEFDGLNPDQINQQLADARKQAEDIVAQAKQEAADIQAEADLLRMQALAFLENPNNFAKNAAGIFINQEGQEVDKFGQLLNPPPLPANGGDDDDDDANAGAGRDILPEDEGNGGFEKNDGLDEFNRGSDAIQDEKDIDDADGGLDSNALIAIGVVGALFCCLVLILVFCLVSKNDSMQEEYGFNVNNQFYDPQAAGQWAPNPPIGPDTMTVHAQPSYSAQHRGTATGNIPSPGANLRQPYSANGRDRFTTAIDVPVPPNYGGTVGSQWGEGKFACRTCGKRYHYQSDQEAHQQKNNH